MESNLFESLSQLQNLGSVELTFTTNGATITLASLSASQDILISKNMTDVPQGIEYVQSYKLWSLAHSIVKINDLDLRNVKAINVPDGETSKPKLKEAFLFEMLSKWSRAMLDVCFRKYGEVLVHADRQSEQGVEFEVFDAQAEIARLEKRIEAIKQSMPAAEVAEEEEEVAEEANTETP